MSYSPILLVHICWAFSGVVRMRAKLREIKQQLRARMHDPGPQTGGWLESVVQGYFNKSVWRARCVFKGLGACPETLRGIGVQQVRSRLCNAPGFLEESRSSACVNYLR